MTQTIPQLGDKVKDEITGFEGIVTGACHYISGCDQYLLQPKVKEDGTKVDGCWFDVDRLVVLEEQVFERRPVVAVGFDAPAPVK